MALGWRRMFDHNHHHLIAKILDAVDGDFFSQAGIHFGGGTYITLRYGKYRASRDVGFFCTAKAYRALRARVFEQGAAAIFKRTDDISLERDIRTDQYAVRQSVKVEGVPIKFEVIYETRFELGPPEQFGWCPVLCLNTLDCFTEKLLANADRWADKASESRDLIDLAVLRLRRPIPPVALDIGEDAYPVRMPLKQAVERFQTNQAYRAQCFQALAVRDPRLIVDGLDLLARDLGLSPTRRAPEELPENTARPTKLRP